ncbi:hypothetical protein, partial [Streptomyces sp. NPDC003635]
MAGVEVEHRYGVGMTVQQLADLDFLPHAGHWPFRRLSAVQFLQRHLRAGGLVEPFEHISLTPVRDRHTRAGVVRALTAGGEPDDGVIHLAGRYERRGGRGSGVCGAAVCAETCASSSACTAATTSRSYRAESMYPSLSARLSSTPACC